jgi:hypothetical protein
MSISAPLPLLDPVQRLDDAAKPHIQHVEDNHGVIGEHVRANAVGRWQDIETMGLVVDKPKADFELMPIILDTVRSDEVLVEMLYSGICKCAPMICSRNPLGSSFL